MISQTLMPLSQTDGRTIATEVLINTPAVANMIREGQVAQLYSAMQAGASVGMHTLDQDLRRLVEEGVIAQNVAKSFAVDPKSLDGAHVRPRDLDAEAWALHAGSGTSPIRRRSPRTPRPAPGSAWGRASARSRRNRGSEMAVMQEFLYRAVDPRGGAVVKGSVEAASETAVTGKLKAQGLTPLEVTLKSKTGLNRELKMPGVSKQVPAKALAIFARQMAGLLNAGLPLMRTLAILIDQTEDKRLQPALVAVQADVEEGRRSQAPCRGIRMSSRRCCSASSRSARPAASSARRSTPSPRTTSARPSCRTRSAPRRPTR
nr:hypothetical protein GCM10025699_23690 [Microbacterium flavescens]